MAVDSDGPTLGAGAASTKDDGTFELKGLTGPRLIRVGNAPPGWTLKSVKLNGTDITDTGTEFKTGETTSGLEVELTNKATAVNGSVTASDGDAPQGLHRRHLLGDARALAAADDPMGHRHAPRSGWPLQGAEPAGRRTIWRWRWTTCPRANGAIPSSSTA